MITKRAVYRKFDRQHRRKPAQQKRNHDSHRLSVRGNVISLEAWKHRQSQRDHALQEKPSPLASQKPTAKQLALLKRLGYDAQVLSKLEAMELIDRLLRWEREVGR